VKIIHVLCSDRKGGLEQAFVNISNSLVQLGYDVEAWIPAAAPYRDDLLNQVVIRPFTVRGFYDVAAMLRARLWLKKSSPDLIITHNSRATSILTKSCLGSAYPILGFSHGDKFNRMKGADRLVVLTEAMRSKSLRSGFKHESVVVFPNMIPCVPSLPAPSVGKSLPTPLSLGFMGRISPEKGLDLLLEALSLLKRRGLSLRLHIAGSGDSEAQVRDMAERLGIRTEVIFDGWVDDIASWLRTIDLAVFPSRYESFGIVVLEAAAYGCPVVATKADGPASQITHGYDGWLADVDSLQSLTDTLLRAIDMYPQWPEVICNAHKRAQRYSMEVLLPELDALIQTAIRSGKRI
jgi:glycosyltransferase involved in cell wall biosynthesis